MFACAIMHKISQLLRIRKLLISAILPTPTGQGFLCSVSVGKIPPEENFGQAIPPEPEKIARYLVLSTQKKGKK